MLTRDDVLEQRLSEAQPIAISSGEGGLKRQAARGDEDDEWRSQMVDRLNRKAGIHGKAWPRLSARPMRVEASRRYQFREGA